MGKGSCSSLLGCKTGSMPTKESSDRCMTPAILTRRSVAFDRWVGRLDTIKTERARGCFVNQKTRSRFTPPIAQSTPGAGLGSGDDLSRPSLVGPSTSQALH